LKKSLLLLLFIVYSHASALEESQSLVTKSNTYSKETQAKIDSLDDTSKELFSEYKSVMAQLETQKKIQQKS
jgi:predicted PurR-regulated permease PerM